MGCFALDPNYLLAWCQEVTVSCGWDRRRIDIPTFIGTELEFCFASILLFSGYNTPLIEAEK